MNEGAVPAALLALLVIMMCVHKVCPHIRGGRSETLKKGGAENELQLEPAYYRMKPVFYKKAWLTGAREQGTTFFF